MELKHLRTIVEGLDSLASIEQEHPVLGKQLLRFVKEVSDCCENAYERLSKALGDVRGLSSTPSQQEIEKVLETINQAPSSKWFKEVSGICNRLEVLAEEFNPAFSEQLDYTRKYDETDYDKLSSLFQLLKKHEYDLKNDIRGAVEVIQTKLGRAKNTGNVENARKYALSVQKEISQSIDEISKISIRIAGGDSKGVERIFQAEIAENALRRPERVLILNMFFVSVCLTLGATVFQFLNIFQFILITGFTLTVVIVINAFYLRTISDLSDENFIRLLELALLKFLAPLMGRRDN